MIPENWKSQSHLVRLLPVTDQERSFRFSRYISLTYKIAIPVGINRKFQSISVGFCSMIRVEPDQLHKETIKGRAPCNGFEYNGQTSSASTLNIKNVTNCCSFFILCRTQVDGYASNRKYASAAVKVSFHPTTSFNNRKRMCFCVENKLIQSNDCLVPKQEV